jgi:hypothetical protein
MDKVDIIHVFDSVYKKLEEMENEGKVDLSIIKEIDILIGQFKRFEQVWIESKRIKVEDAFLLYHCSRNSSYVLTKMRTKFLEAEKKHLNPKVAQDAQQIIPTLNALYEIVNQPFEGTLSKEQQMHMIQRLEEMRNIASSISLLPTFQEETKDINMTRYRRHFQGLAELLQANYFEE